MKYYKTDSRKISFSEYFRVSPKGFWLGWINKILGIQMNFICGIPGPQPFKDRLIAVSNVPIEISEKLNFAIQELQKIGFDQFWHYTSTFSLSGGQGYGVEALHPSQQILAKVVYVSFMARESFVIGLVSEVNDGMVLGTSNKKPDFNTPPNHIIQRQIGASAQQLMSLHQQKMVELSRDFSFHNFSTLEEIATF